MKKLLLVILIFVSFSTQGSHLLGGIVGVFQTSQDSTTVGVSLIADPQGLPASNTITVEKWEMNSVGWYVQNGTITLTQAITPIPFQGFNIINYTSEYLDLDSNKYRFIYRNCCWGFVNNSNNSLNSQFIISADYWHIPYNSTPYSRVPFIINQQVNTRNTMAPLWGWNAFLNNTDTWDIVSISQTDLHSGYANGVFVPQNYSQLSMYVNNDSISWIPQTLGRYSTGFEIADYRNGVKIGIQRIQWTFIVLSSVLGIDEFTVKKKYKVYDTFGRFIGVDYHGLKGLYILKYEDGNTEKIYVR
jgi:hypothetical protein